MFIWNIYRFDFWRLTTAQTSRVLYILNTCWAIRVVYLYGWESSTSHIYICVCKTYSILTRFLTWAIIKERAHTHTRTTRPTKVTTAVSQLIDMFLVRFVANRLFLFVFRANIWQFRASSLWVAIVMMMYATLSPFPPPIAKRVITKLNPSLFQTNFSDYSEWDSWNFLEIIGQRFCYPIFPHCCHFALSGNRVPGHW